MNELYSILIAVYNSDESLKIIHERLVDVFENKLSLPYEIIFIDDCSSNPNSWNTIQQICISAPNVKGIRLSKNVGQDPALMCAMKYAKGDYIILIDDDLQHNPYDIPKLIERKEHDVVIAAFHDKKHSFIENLGSKFKGWTDQLLLNKPRKIKHSSFFMFKKSIKDSIIKNQNPYNLFSSLMFPITDDVVNVYVSHYERLYNKSGYNFRKKARLILRLVLSNADKLLIGSALFGLLMSGLSFVGSIIIILKRILFGVDVLGWTSIMFVILFFSGAILFTVSISGWYLLRILKITERRQTYFVKETSGIQIENEESGNNTI
ncbi:glycosyltransferase [Bacteroidota bacterium]